MNYFTLCLLFSRISPYLSLILSLTLVLIFKSFDSLILCDEEGLVSIEELKELIKSDVVKLNKFLSEAKSLEQEAESLDYSFDHYGSVLKKDQAWDKVDEKLCEAARVYKNIFLQEAKVKKSDSNYSCGLEKQKNHDSILDNGWWD